MDKKSSTSIQFTKPASGEPAFKVDNWTSYSFVSDFFNPVDSFTFEISDDRVNELQNKIFVGDPVELVVNDQIECKGFVEEIQLSYDNRSGTTLRLSGRDLLGVVTDATIPPNVTVKDTNTFEEALLKAFEPFGWTKDKIAFINFNNVADFKPQSVQKNSGRRKSTKLKHFMKPHKNEGYMEYALRICKQSGWNIKLSPDGSYISIGMPTYEINDINEFIHLKKDPSNNNILSASLRFDTKKLPSYIIGEASGFGGNFRKQPTKVFVPNYLLVNQQDIIKDAYSKLTYKPKITDNNISDVPGFIKAFMPEQIKIGSEQAKSVLRPLNVFDDEAKNLASLTYATQRKMADMQNQCFSIELLTSGHAFTDSKSVLNHKINSMVRLIDDSLTFNGIDNTFWVQRREFTKSRSGTFTKLTLKIPYLYSFAEIAE